MPNLLQMLLGLLMVFFIPGYLLMNAVFPRKGSLDTELDLLYRVVFGIGLSMVLAILVSFGLNALGVDPETGLGYIDAPYLWLSFSVLSLVFFLIGWYRGAYPILGKVHPRLLRMTRAEPRSFHPVKRSPEIAARIQALSAERARMARDAEAYERKEAMHTGVKRRIYTEKKQRALEEIERLDNELTRLTGGENLEG
ncbi:MAG: DUF1616 domain-containing protein [Candidatus Thermoplasmatota archaeon]